MKNTTSSRRVSSRVCCCWVMIIGLMVLMTGCSFVPSTKPYLAQDRNERWVNDINYLEKTLPRVHKNLYFHLSELEFHRQLAVLKTKVSGYTDEQIEIELSMILAGIGDTHTGSSIGSESLYPLELHWFKEGIYIVGTCPEYQELLDARIITLNGKKIEEAAHTLKPLLAGANESWFKTQVTYYLPIPGVLKYFNLNHSDEIELGVQVAHGEMKKVKMKPMSYKEYVAIDRSAEPVPLYQTHPGENYWYEYLPKEKILYLNYRICRQMREKPFEIFNQEFWDFAESHKADKLVIDLRQNRGGISPIFDPFIKKLRKSSFNEKGSLYVIIGRDTYSSAVLNAISLRQKTKACFVGEATGGRPNHYGEVKEFKLPNSQKAIRYSTKYFKWYKADVAAINPDVTIAETFKAYQNARDPVLEWIVSRGR